MRQLFAHDARAVVFHGKYRNASLSGKRHRDLPGSAVPGGVFQKVCEYLLYQYRVHRHEQHRFREVRCDLNAREMRFKLGNGGENDFLGHLVLLFDMRRFQTDARDRQKVLHHADEPFGVGVDAAEKLFFLPIREIFVFEKRDRRAGDRRERRAQIVRYRPQEVRAHTLALRFHTDALLPLESCRQRVDRKRHRKHREKGERIAGQSEIEIHVWVGENIVHRENAQNRDDRAAEIPIRQKRHQQNA